MVSSNSRSKLHDCRPAAPVISIGNRNSPAGRAEGGAGRLLRGSESELGTLVVGVPAEITVASAGGIDTATRATIATPKHRVRFSIVSLLLFMGRVASDAWVATPPERTTPHAALAG